MHGSENMNTNDRFKFLAWYAEKDNNIFDFKKEMDEYCRADVVVLRKACLRFRSMLLYITRDAHHTGIDPFSYLTIASVCMTIFKSKFLPETWQINDELVVNVLIKDQHKNSKLKRRRFVTMI